MKPYERLPDRVTYKGRVYKVDFSYATFFAVSDVLDDDALSDYMKVETALDLFIRRKHPVDAALLREIYELIKPRRPAPPSGLKTMDIEQDWGYICASFMQAYGINLHEDKSIHILRFQELLQGLPKDTKLVEVVGIRAAKMPTPTKTNAEERAQLSKLKAQYALTDRTKDFQEGLAGLFALLEAGAKNGG